MPSPGRNNYQKLSKKKAILAILIVIIVITGCKKDDEPETDKSSLETGYYTLDEFLENNSIEKEHFESFRLIVQEKAVPLANGIQGNSIRIAMVYPGNQKSDYWTRSVSSFSARMDELKIQYELIEFFSRPGAVDRDIQEEQINEALQSDPDYLVFTLAVSRHKELIERIITIGRPKLIIQNITTPLKEWYRNQPFLYVGFSHKLGTEEILIPEFLKRTEGQGSYAMLYYAKGFVSEQRGNTFIKYMDENSDLELKSAFYTDGQFDKAREATIELLDNYPDIDFIYACSTNIALAAVEVLEDRGLKNKILVNGWGGGSAELDSIMNGRLDFTVMRMNDDNGIAMAEAIKLDVSGDGNRVPTVYSGDFVLVSNETSYSELNRLRMRAFRYSGIDE